MKTKVSALLISIILVTLSSCIPHNIVKGDGNLVTKTITISDYDEFQASHSHMDIEYVQSDANPFLEITTDENIFEMYEFVSENHSLKIRPKREYRRNTHFRPTKFTVKTNSSVLRDIDLAGSSEMDINGPFISDKLEIDLAGSGRINLNDTASITSLEIDIAGSGKLYANYLKADRFDASIAGSGDLELAGEGGRANIEIAGSGKMKAIDFVVDEVKTEIAGSGNIEVTAVNKLIIKVAGSGNVKYKGDPEIEKHIAGSGKITKID